MCVWPVCVYDRSTDILHNDKPYSAVSQNVFYPWSLAPVKWESHHLFNIVERTRESSHHTLDRVDAIRTYLLLYSIALRSLSLSPLNVFTYIYRTDKSCWDKCVSEDRLIWFDRYWYLSVLEKTFHSGLFIRVCPVVLCLNQVLGLIGYLRNSEDMMGGKEMRLFFILLAIESLLTFYHVLLPVIWHSNICFRL